MRRYHLVLAVAALLAALLPLPAGAVAVPRGTVLFPSDELTVADNRQVTGRRVALPLPDCDAEPSTCDELRLLNELDGFDLDPRIAVQLRAPLHDPSAVDAAVFFVEPPAGGQRIAVNRLVYDADDRMLYGQPRRQLDAATTYHVTWDGAGPASTMTFTTLSATVVLTQMRRQLDDGSAYQAAGIAADERGLSFDIRDGGEPAVFAATDVARITRHDERVKGGELEEAAVPNTAVIAAGRYAFGVFRSPSWLTQERFIPHTASAVGAPRVRGFDEVGVTLIVPAGTPPQDGWPVAIFGPGITRSKYDVFLAADANAARGVATMSLDPVGHAYGPRSETGVTTASSGEVRFPAFGRATVTDDAGVYDPIVNVRTPAEPHPLASVNLRDGLRQTAADVMALVRAVARGVDVDGDGSSDLRRDGVALYAQSLGGIYGTMAAGVDPQLGVAALNVPGGPIVDIARLSPSFRPSVATQLADRRPGLLNGGRDCFTESLPLWAEPPESDPAHGAIPIQEFFSRVNWVNRPGSPETFAPLLRTQPLADSDATKVFYQYAFGDVTVPNPTSATIMRAGGLADRTTFYRNDKTPTANSNPHGFLLDPRITGREQAQAQVLDFIARAGQGPIDPDGPLPTFEVPITDPSELEQLNFDFDRFAAQRDNSQRYASADGSDCPLPPPS